MKLGEPLPQAKRALECGKKGDQECSFLWIYRSQFKIKHQSSISMYSMLEDEPEEDGADEYDDIDNW